MGWTMALGATRQDIIRDRCQDRAYVTGGRLYRIQRRHVDVAATRAAQAAEGSA